MAEAFDPYYRWLGIREPARPPNHYRLLGLELFEEDPDVIASAADRQMAHVRTFQHGRHSEWSQKLLNELAAAKVCLLHTNRKAEYDQWLRSQLLGGAAAAVSAPPPPAVIAAPPAPAGPAPQPIEAAASTAQELLPQPLPPTQPAPQRAQPEMMVVDRPDAVPAKKKPLWPRVLAIAWTGVLLAVIAAGVVYWPEAKPEGPPSAKRKIVRIGGSEKKEGGQQVEIPLDPNTDKQPAVLSPQKSLKAGEPLLAVAYLADGKTAVTAGYEETIDLWNLETGERVDQMEGHSAPVHELAVSPDGIHLASAADDDTVMVWNLRARYAALNLRELKQVTTLAFGPDGKTLVAGNKAGAVVFWEIPSGKVLKQKAFEWGAIHDFAFLPEKNQLLLATESPAIEVLSLDKLHPVEHLRAHRQAVMSLAVSPDGSRLASAGDDNAIWLWDLPNRRPLQAFDAHERGVRSVAFSGDGLSLVSGGMDRTVRWWSVPLFREMGRCEPLRGPVFAVAMTPKQPQAISISGADVHLYVWDISGKKPASAASKED